MVLGEDLICRSISLLQILKIIIKFKFNYGNHNRDFTFVDDIVQGISKAVYKYSKRSNKEKFEVFNLAVEKNFSFEIFKNN